MRSTLSRLAREKGHRVRVMGVLSAVVHMAKARVKKTLENPKEPKVRTKVPKAHTKAKHRKLVGLSGLENSKSETSS